MSFKIKIISRKNGSINTFWQDLFYQGKWKVVGGVIGKVNGREIQKLEEIIIAFSFIRVVIYPKNRYVFY